MAAQNFEGALLVFARALSVRETEGVKAMFVGCLQRARHIPSIPTLRDLVARAMSEPWARPASLAYAAVHLIKEETAVGEGIRRVRAVWPRRLTEGDLFGAAGAAAIADDRLLRVALEAAPVCDADLERFLTTLRSELLETASTDAGARPQTDAVLAMFCALARQCFVNEYVFALADGELERAQRLRDRVEHALRSPAPLPPLLVAAVAAYFPLHSLDGAETLLARAWPVPIDRLLTQQVREPREELELRAIIPRLTAITDDVSLKVQQQYETHPYPRWLMVRAPSRSISIDAYLRGRFPEGPFRVCERRGAVEYLMAGCGTGQTVVETARLIAPVKILAIDLSLTSLAYAKRKAAEFGLSDIEFAQADIMELPSLGRSFDVINCSGVLHHLADPFCGWKMLITGLRSGGLMRVAVYSEAARRHNGAARSFIAAHPFAPTPADIRRCRQEIMDLPESDPVRREARNSDFFSMSGCRDWLFHVRERPLTLLEIAQFLADNALDFIGFEVASGVAARYAARFPHDRSRTDLGSWHRFEQENTSTFIGMYQFWLQKR